MQIPWRTLCIHLETCICWWMSRSSIVGNFFLQVKHRGRHCSWCIWKTSFFVVQQLSQVCGFLTGFFEAATTTGGVCTIASSDWLDAKPKQITNWIIWQKNNSKNRLKLLLVLSLGGSLGESLGELVVLLWPLVTWFWLSCCTSKWSLEAAIKNNFVKKFFRY